MRASLKYLPVLLLFVIIAFAGCNHRGNLFNGNSGGPKDVVTVFFSKYQGSQSIVEEVVRKLPPDAQNDALHYAMGELLKGPNSEEKSQGFYSEIPQGTQLLGVDENGDTVTVNFSKQFAAGGGSNSMNQRFEQVKQTAQSVDSQHQLQIAVEGKPLDTLGGEGLEVQESLKRQPQ